MSSLIVNGGKALSGTIKPSGNKNSVLPILCASVMCKEEVVIQNVPEITDVNKIIEFLENLGSKILWDKEQAKLILNNKNLNNKNNPNCILPAGIRSTVLLIPPLLFRLNLVSLHSDTKGCTLGVREIDPHIDTVKEFGVDVSKGELTKFINKSTFKACDVWLEYASVTTTENFLMLAAATSGNSTINNAACEPHVQDLCNFLVKMGAKITGIGTSRLEVTGCKEFVGGEIEVSDDHHEITTFLALGAITGGEIKVLNRSKQHFPLINKTFANLGVKIEEEGEYSVVYKNQKLKVKTPHTQQLLLKIEAAPWPYVPADLLPPFISLAACCEGNTMIWNKVYEGALSWLPELAKFGTKVFTCDPHRAIVFGNQEMYAATVEAPYIIRVIIAMFMIAARTPGESIIRHADPIKRAHPRFVENLQLLGADVRWA